MKKKLGLVIDRVYEGKEEIYNCNKSDWAIRVCDMREIFNEITGLDNSSNPVVRMIKFEQNGCYICLLLQIAGGRPGDHLAAWVFVANDVKIDEHDLNTVVVNTAKQLSSGSINYEKLDELFAKEYETRQTPFSYAPSAVQGYGYRMCPDIENSLGEIFKNLYQPYYSEYKFVFLLDSASSVRCTDGVDLSSKPIDEYVMLLPPLPNSDGFIGHLADGEFLSPICVKKNSQLTITWKRDGYRSVSETTIVKEDEQVADSIKRDKYRKIIKPSDFTIVDQKNSTLSSFSIKINDNQLKDTLSVAEDNLKKVKLSVSKEGYDTCNMEDADLTQLPITIRLEESKLKFIFIIPLLGLNEKKETVVEYTNKWEEKSILEGYELAPVSKDKQTNTFTYRLSPKTNKKKTSNSNKPNNDRSSSRLILIVLLCVLGLMISFGSGYMGRPLIDRYFSKTEVVDSTASNTNENDSPDPDSMATNQALEYLEANDKWEKPQMDAIENLKGFWDELNEFQYDKIIARETVLADSKKYQKLLELAKKNKELKNYDSTKRICIKKDDFKITFDNCVGQYEKISAASSSNK